MTVVAGFTGDAGATPGAVPRSGLVDDGTGTLWGTASQGGESGFGTVFKFAPGTRTFTSVVEFTGANGSQPEASLVSDGAGLLWGTTRDGGANGHGTVFTIDAATGALTTIVEFTGTNGTAPGSQPKAALVRDGAGVWWGTTSAGGAALGSAPEAAMIAGAGGSLRQGPSFAFFAHLYKFTGTIAGASSSSRPSA